MNRHSLAAYAENERRRRRFRADPSGRYGYVALQHLSDNANGFVLDAINDLVLVKRNGFPEFLGTMAQALAAGILVNPSAPTKWLFNSSGILTSGSNLRCQYSAAGVPLGFLPEPQRQNLWLRSSDLSVSPWIWSSSGGGETVLSGDTSAYGGTLWTVMLGTSAADRRQYSVIAANTQTSVAFNVKRGNQPISSALYQVLGGTGTQTAYLSYNHDTDTVTAGVSGVSGIVLNGSGREIISDSEVRVWLVFTPSNGGTTGYLLLHRQFGVSFASTDTAQYGHVQVEYGAYPTSYTKTEDSAATRNADNLYVDLTKVPFDPAVYTVIVHAQPSPESASAAHLLFGVGDNTINERHQVSSGTPGTGNLGGVWCTGNVLQASLTSSAAALSAFKVATATAINDFEIVSNGASGGTDAAGDLPINPTRFQIGAGYLSLGSWSAPVGFLALIPERLSQADMIARTTL